jgi:hypothetical protein
MAEAANGARNGLLATVSDKLVKALPPAMLVLVLLNICFIGVVGYIFQHNSEQRNALLTRIVENCLLQNPRQ